MTAEKRTAEEDALFRDTWTKHPRFRAYARAIGKTPEGAFDTDDRNLSRFKKWMEAAWKAFRAEHKGDDMGDKKEHERLDAWIQATWPEGVAAQSPPLEAPSSSTSKASPPASKQGSLF